MSKRGVGVLLTGPVDCWDDGITQFINGCNTRTCSCPGTGCTGYEEQPTDYCAYPITGCPPGWFNQGCCTAEPSPIIIDLDGDGFDLTDAPGGVDFDISAAGQTHRVSWTSRGSDDAWLALDRNGNGVIDDGGELFGNFTDQPASDERNGFVALAVFDQPSEGGNGDGRIGSEDAVFRSLLLWRDLDHDGYSASSELRAVSRSDIVFFDLDYQESKWVDVHGNQFRYRSRIKTTRGSPIGKWVFDVFLVTVQ